MKPDLQIGDTVKLLQYGACPDWKLQYIGQTAKVLDAVHNRV